MIIRPGHIPGYPAGGQLGRVSRRPVYPTTATEFAAYTGLTPTSLYLFNEASGNLLDKSSSNDLTVNGTPTFSFSRSNQRGIHYDTETDHHSADVLAVGSTSFLAWGVFGVETGAVDFAGLMGRTNATGAEEWIVYHRTSGVVTARIRDAAAGEVSVSTAAASLDTALHLVQLQVDRSAATVRLRVSRPGTAALTASGSIAGFGSLDGASQKHGYCPLIGSVPFKGGSCYGAGTRINADTEGASVTADLSKALGWE